MVRVLSQRLSTLSALSNRPCFTSLVDGGLVALAVVSAGAGLAAVLAILN